MDKRVLPRLFLLGVLSAAVVLADDLIVPSVITIPGSSCLATDPQQSFSQEITLSSSGADLQLTSVQGPSWISVFESPLPVVTSSGTTLTLIGAPGLSLGRQFDFITFTASGATNGPQTAFLDLTCFPPPTIAFVPENMTVSVAAGSSQQFTTHVSGQDPQGAGLTELDFDVSSGTPWLTGYPTSSKVAPGANVGVSFTVNAQGLAAGYSGPGYLIIVDGGNNSTDYLTLNLTVTSPPASLQVTPLQPSGFTCSGNSCSPASATLNVTSSSGAVPFVAAATANWLVVSQSSAATPATVTISVNPANLPSGGSSYTGRITITPQGGTAVNVDVPLTVQAQSASHIISHVVNGQGWKTSILLVNADTQNASFTLKFWNDSGQPFAVPLIGTAPASSIAGTLAPGQLRVIESDGLGNSAAEGWAELDSAQAIGGTGIFGWSTPGRLPSEAAVPFDSAAGTDLVIPFDNTPGPPTFVTGIALANPNSQAAVVAVHFNDESGQAISASRTQITIPKSGHTASVLADDFPEVKGKRGTVQFSSNVQIYGLGIRANGQAFTSIGALANVPPGRQVISHVTNGAGWRTSILLVNTDSHSASYTLKFWSDSGAPLTLPLLGAPAAASVAGTLAPGQSRTIETDGLGNSAVEGWAELDTTGAIGGTGIFAWSAPGALPSEAAVPLNSLSGDELVIPFDNTSGSINFITGIALANPSPQSAAVAVTLTDESGANIPTARKQLTIPQNGHFSSVLADDFPESKGKRGTIRFTSGVELYGLGIRANGQAFTSIDAIPR